MCLYRLQAIYIETKHYAEPSCTSLKVVKNDEIPQQFEKHSLKELDQEDLNNSNVSETAARNVTSVEARHRWKAQW